MVISKDTNYSVHVQALLRHRFYCFALKYEGALLMVNVYRVLESDS